MFLIKDRLRMYFERLGWKFQERIEPSEFKFFVDLEKSGKKFTIEIIPTTMDKILASETFLRYWIEDIDKVLNDMLSLGGTD